MNIGYDLGRTIKGPTKNDYNKAFPDALEVIAKLSKRYSNSYIISRVNSEQRERAIKWLIDEDFYNKTGIKQENVYFCFDRRDKHLFVKALDINVFIDDRYDVLEPMGDKVTKLLFNPNEIDLNKFYNTKLENFLLVMNWKQIETMLI